MKSLTKKIGSILTAGLMSYALMQTPAKAAGLYILDGFGGVHPAQGAPKIPAGTGLPYFGYDIAKKIDVSGEGDRVRIDILDGCGAIHTRYAYEDDFEQNSSQGSPYFGWDVARDFDRAPRIRKEQHELDDFPGLFIRENDFHGKIVVGGYSGHNEILGVTELISSLQNGVWERDYDFEFDVNGNLHELEYRRQDVSENIITFRDEETGDSIEVSYTEGARLDGTPDAQLIIDGVAYDIDVDDIYDDGDIAVRTINSLNVNPATLDYYIGDPFSENLISIGGPDTNLVTAKLLGFEGYVSPEQAGINENTGIIRIVQRPGSGVVGIVVAGYTPEYTRMAAKVLANYWVYDLHRSDREVIVNSLTDIVVNR